MRKQPKLSDYIFHPSTLSKDGISWHNQSIKEDIINSSTAKEFYIQLGDDLYQGIKDCLNDGSSIEILIDKISELASQAPAIDIDFEKQHLPQSIKSQDDLINWRKEKYWKKNVTYITESILLASRTIFEEENKKYNDYIKYYNTLSEDEKKDNDKFEDYVLV